MENETEKRHECKLIVPHCTGFKMPCTAHINICTCISMYCTCWYRRVFLTLQNVLLDFVSNKICISAVGLQNACTVYSVQPM